jgi:magnesium transporter
MISYYHQSKDEEKLIKSDEFVPDSWICAEGLESEELDLLVKRFSLEEGHLRDALDPYEVPRMEVEDGVVYMFTRVPVQVKRQIMTVPLLIVLGKDFVLSVSREKLDLYNSIVRRKRDISAHYRVNFFLHLILTATDSYGRYLTDIARTVRVVLPKIDRIKNKDIVQFVEYEQLLNDFLSALVPTAAILRTLLKGRTIMLEEHDEDLTEDLFLETEQLIETSKATQKNIVNIRDAYSTIMTHELNRVMKVLTALTIVFTVPTMISSFYGMNIKLPFGEQPSAYLLILGVTVIFVAGLIGLFVRNKWL